METSHFEVDNITQRTSRNSYHWETENVTYYLINISYHCHQIGLPGIQGFLRDVSRPWNAFHSLKQADKEGVLSRYFVLYGIGCVTFTLEEKVRWTAAFSNCSYLKCLNDQGCEGLIWTFLVRNADRQAGAGGDIWNGSLLPAKHRKGRSGRLEAKLLASLPPASKGKGKVTSTRVHGFQCLSRTGNPREVGYFYNRCRGSGKTLLPPAVPFCF